MIYNKIQYKVASLLDVVLQYESNTFSASSSKLTLEEAEKITESLVLDAIQGMILLDTLDGVRLSEELENIRPEEELN